MSNTIVVNSNLVKELNEAKNTFVAFLEAKGCVIDVYKSGDSISYHEIVDGCIDSENYSAYFKLSSDGCISVKYSATTKTPKEIPIKEFLQLIKNHK